MTGNHITISILHNFYFELIQIKINYAVYYQLGGITH
jgi:hypothetical protein